jgi:predicted RNA binding protein YcfA (HicA-like mRNA interferase family)
MPSIPVLSGQELAKFLETFGWTIVRQRGSHMILTREGSKVTLSVPNHKTIARGALRSIIRLAGLTPEEFLAHLANH